MQWQRCSRRDFISCFGAKCCHLFPVIAQRFQCCHRAPLSESRAGGELLCSLLFICSTLQGWSPTKTLWHADSGSKDHQTIEMFCSLTRCFVLLCSEMPSEGNRTNWWIPLQMDCSHSWAQCLAWISSETHQELKSLQMSFSLWDFSLWLFLRAFNSHSKSNLHLSPCLCSCSFNCGCIWTRGAHTGFDDNWKQPWSGALSYALEGTWPGLDHSIIKTFCVYIPFSSRKGGIILSVPAPPLQTDNNLLLPLSRGKGYSLQTPPEGLRDQNMPHLWMALGHWDTAADKDLLFMKNSLMSCCRALMPDISQPWPTKQVRCPQFLSAE